MFIYFKKTLEISKCCRKANGIWICRGEEGGLKGNSWLRKPSIRLGCRARRGWEGVAKCQRERERGRGKEGGGESEGEREAERES